MLIPIPFEKKIKVENDVIDHFNHVNNLAYIQWVLDISKKHWTSFSLESVRNQFGWMILKHEVHYKKQAKLNDELIIKTWIDDFSTATSVRKTTITNTKTKQLIFDSEAQWCFISLKTLKPTRLTSDILKPYFENL
ncbi:thioesterase family protein [Flavobacterium sp. CS20]|uniref:acyl-CoA thioesterase n=1 Tax=Flavobacterium sp. CS20 TaxID=2775246 RepID=UPI001B3A6860|nr:acyl-CoA thioesterase [Flavobacterium sp. CS20]QTY28369.1 acyl-CoA thioesterase [Flavobacterium sp. CS20]